MIDLIDNLGEYLTYRHHHLSRGSGIHMNSKVAVVTGASRGIGRAVAERLGADGARVIVNYHSDAVAAKDAVAAVERAGGRATAVRADVRDATQLSSLVEAAVAEYGGLDVLVSNTGMARPTSLADATDEDLDLHFAINTRPVFRALKEAVLHMRHGGRVVVISSGATVVAHPGAGLYAASKAAAEQLARTAAHELGPRGITVNSVLPGATRTEALQAQMPADVAASIRSQTPLGRLGEPADIASVVAFLVSDEGAWINGQTIHASGGLF
ncbi:SDR family oxidoreductase [Nocardiopsis dassonvillei]|uniref:SDR family oxidoreductase n=1 Tax=Nocardiopsis dassonvillei TaxID=2014 RepID=UPI00366B2EE2